MPGLLVLALLIGHAAAGLAGGLARGLALAAAAVLSALAHVAGFKRLDSLHNRYLQFSFRFGQAMNDRPYKRKQYSTE